MSRKANCLFLAGFLFWGLTNPLHSQKWEYKSYTFHVGAVATIANQLSLEQLQSRFSNIEYLKTDLSSFHYDSSVFHYGVFPVLLEFELALAKTDSTKRFFRNSEIRFKLGYSTEELAYENRVRENFQGVDPMNYDTIYRDYYSFWWITNNVYAGADLVFKSGYFGKHKRSRVWAGGGLSIGISTGTFTSYHLLGTFEGREIFSDQVYPEYEYFFPALELKETTRSNRVPVFARIDLDFPGGYEIALGAKRKFHLGLQIRPGYMWLINPNEQFISGVTADVSYTLRFLIAGKEVVE